MASLIRGPFAAALKYGRRRYNSRFLAARQLGGTLSADDLAGHLVRHVAPLFEAAAARAPEG